MRGPEPVDPLHQRQLLGWYRHWLIVEGRARQAEKFALLDHREVGVLRLDQRAPSIEGMGQSFFLRKVSWTWSCPIWR